MLMLEGMWLLVDLSCLDV